MRVLLIAGAAGLATYALPTLAQMAGGPVAAWGRAVTRTQAEEEARARFALADINKDGYVTRDEIRAGIEARLTEHRNMAFDRIDADHDGKITREEFSSRANGPAAPRIVERRLERVSPDGAAKKDPRGMHVMMTRSGRPGGGMMMSDTDKDGRISQAEAVGVALKRFDQIDSDHDGTVTPQERGAAMQDWRTRMREWGGKMRAGSPGDLPLAPPPPPAD